MKQVAGQPMSKVRPILASHHLKITTCYDLNTKKYVNLNSVPGDYYLVNISPWAPARQRSWSAPSSSMTAPSTYPA